MAGKVEPITKLGEHNYPTWRLDCTASLMLIKCWDLVDGTWTEPDEDADNYQDWVDKKQQASGLIWSTLGPSAKAMIQDLLGEPVLMWNRLASLTQVESPASRFIA